MIGWRKERDVSLLQVDDSLEVRLEVRKLRGGSRFAPRMLSCGHNEGVLRHETSRHIGRLAVIARGDRHHAVLRRIGIEPPTTPVQRFERPADGVRGELLVSQPPHRRLHLAVDLRAAGGHAHPLVPFQELCGMPEVDDLADQILQCAQWSVHTE